MIKLWQVVIMLCVSSIKIYGYEIKIVELEQETEFYGVILDKITTEAAQKTGLSKVKPFYLEIRDDNNKLIGGLAGYEFYGSLLIDILWVDPDHRKKGLGSRLLKKAEELAIKSHLKFITVASMEFWGCKSFYEKNGFTIEYIREGFAGDFKQYNFIKELKY